MNSVFNFADYPVIVGIDFGTTYSGCSYASSHGDDVFDVLRWPKNHASVYPKAPTLALYRNGSKAAVEWGYAAQRSGSRPGNKDFLISKIKLHLDENLHHEPLPNSLTALDVITDYLRMLHKHICNELSKGFASHYTQDRYRYCLTVPAMWSDKAKALMRKAATQAGLVRSGDHPERLMLISEPEAAALYCEKKAEQFNLSKGQRFLICDAGGGTVDLVVFEIDNIISGSRTLKEVTRGHGGSCGSGFIDMRMRDYLRNRLSGIANIRHSAMEILMDAFVNNTKPNFDGIEDQYLDLPTGVVADMDNPMMGIQDGQIHLPAQDLRDHVFEPVVQQVLRLIDEQLMQAPQLEILFLVGGFGQSMYLFNRINERFGRRIGMIASPPRGELAVVRGAVYFGLNPKIITERVSRRTYGVECRMLFENGLDPINYSAMDVDGRLYCRHRFSPYVRKGETIKVDQAYEKRFSVTYPMHTDSDLYAFDGDGIPPRVVTHHLVKKVGNFPIRMPVLEGVYPGERVDFHIRMFFGHTEIKIETTVRDKTFIYTSAFDADEVSATPRNPLSPDILRHLSDPPHMRMSPQYTLGRNRASSSVNDLSSESNATLVPSAPDENSNQHRSSSYKINEWTYNPVKPQMSINEPSPPMNQHYTPTKPQPSVRYHISNQYNSTPVLAAPTPPVQIPPVHTDYSASTTNLNNTYYSGGMYSSKLSPAHLHPVPTEQKSQQWQQQQELRQYPTFPPQQRYPQNDPSHNDFPPPPEAFASMKPAAFD